MNGQVLVLGTPVSELGKRWQKEYNQYLGGFNDPKLHDDLLGYKWPDTTIKYSQPETLPDTHADYDSQFEHIFGDEGSDIRDFIDDKIWEKQPIQEKLTPEQKEALRRYNEYHLNLVPDNWQKVYEELKKRPDITDERYQELLKNEHQDYDQIKLDLNLWEKTFPGLNALQVRTEYDKPKETHSASDLKPTDLPSDWKTQIANSTILKKRLNSISSILKIVISEKVKIEKK